jgi:hypothetical protein
MDGHNAGSLALAFALEVTPDLHSIAKSLAKISRQPGPSLSLPSKLVEKPSPFFSVLERHLDAAETRLHELKESGCRRGSPEEETVVTFLAALEELTQAS